MTDHRTPCERFDEEAAELALGLLDPRVADELTAHAATCGRCRTELDALASTVDGLVDLAPEMDPPAGFAARALLAMAPPEVTHPEPASPGRRRVSERHRTRMLAGAAIVALLVGVATLVWLTQPADSPTTSVATAALLDPGGSRHGSAVIAHRTGGNEATLTLTLTDVPAATYHCVVVGADGRSREVASWPVVRRGTDVWTMRVDAGDDGPVAVAVSTDDGAEVARATFG